MARRPRPGKLVPWQSPRNAGGGHCKIRPITPGFSQETFELDSGDTVSVALTSDGAEVLLGIDDAARTLPRASGDVGFPWACLTPSEAAQLERALARARAAIDRRET